MHKKSPPLTATILAVLMAAATLPAQNFSPVAITPGSYTQDIIVENTTAAPQPYAYNCAQGSGLNLSGDYTLFEQGLYNGYSYGMPPHGSTFTHKSNPNIQFVMPPDYTVNNCMFIDSSVTFGTLTLDTATAATNLSILCTSGGGSTTVDYTVNHADFSTETGTITIGDWWNGANFAWTNSGRVYQSGAYNNIGAADGNPRLYSSEITLTNTSPVVSIDFSYSSGSGHAGIYAVSGNAGGSSWTPIPVGGFNYQVIVAADFPLTATMDQGTNTLYSGNLNTWFEKGYATPAGYPDSGLPHPGEFLTNVLHSTRVYQMASDYAANNAILIDTNHQTANITPISPAAYTAFAILTAGGNIGGGNIMTNMIIMQHENGVSETNLFFAYDWFATNSQIAYVAGGRVNMGARTLNNLASPVTLANNPKLFESTFGLADAGSPVTNIIVKYLAAPGVNSTTYILAVSATAGAVAPAIAAQPSRINVFEGGTTNMPVTLSAGDAPLSYQWQQNNVDVSDGGAFSGATTSDLTVANASFSESGNYQLIITNAAGAITSAPIVLTVMSTNPDVTLPGDLVAAYQPNGGSSPGTQGPANAINNTTAKYLNFGANGGAPFFGPVGFVVTPSQGSSIVTGVRVYAANDSEGRDPVDYTLEGSTDGTNFTFISSGALSLHGDRNGDGNPLNPIAQSLAEANFANATGYSSYRVSFSNVKDPDNANSMQLAEVELLGTLLASSPMIVVDINPSNVTAFVGLTTTLNITASGTPPLYYQWKLNSADVPDATNTSYAFPTLAGTNEYSCTVSNAVGPAVSSSTATVVGVELTPTTTFAVNFHNAQNFAAGVAFGYQHIEYVGQGAYVDAGNDTWNGWLNNDGFAAPAMTSGDILTPIALTLTNVGFNSGGIYNAPYPDGAGGNTLQGMPGFVMGQNAAVNNNNVGGFILSSVPEGSYDLYLYGANYDNDRGANFTVGGNTLTANNDPSVNGTHPGTNFMEGLNYVVFHNLAPDTNGVISGTWDGIFTNPNTGQSGEGCFNGLQLVKVPGDVVLTITPNGSDVIVSWSPDIGELQAADVVTGTYTNVVGATSPYTNTPSASEQYFRVKVQ